MFVLYFYNDEVEITKMSLVETLYAAENPDHNRMLWNKFPFLSPNFSYLKMDYTKQAIAEENRRFSLDAFEFCFFPGASESMVNEGVRKYMNRGIRAVNSLCERYIDEEARAFLRLEEVQEPLDLFEFVKAAYENWERGTTRVRRVNPGLRILAYNSMRALELGYRVGTIDEAPEVQKSLEHSAEITGRIENLLGCKNPQEFDNGFDSGPNTRWETDIGIHMFSTSEKKPMAARIKYLDKTISKPRYDSILMKIYSDLIYPSEIRDYTGVEIIVKDDEARDRLISYFRIRTRPAGTFEGFKDTTTGDRLNEDSRSYRVIKFFLRVPAILKVHKQFESVRISNEMIPVEIQILTLEDARNRDSIPEVSHFEYKKRRFMRVFPGLFPRELYKPLLS